MQKKLFSLSRLSTDQDAVVILALVGLGLAIRLAMWAVIDPIPSLSAGDSEYYLAVARSLSEDGRHWINGAPTAYRPPLYPAFLALVFIINGAPVHALVLQAGLGIATGVITFALLKNRHRGLAICTAVLIVTSPFLIVYENKLVAEALYIPLLWLGWLLLFTSLFPGHRSRAAAAGVLFGLTVLTRETFIALPVVAFLAILASRDWRSIGQRLLIASALAFLVVVPWAVRNASLPTERVATTEGRFGLNLWVGTWERDGDWALPGVLRADFPEYAFRTQGEKRQLIAALQNGNDAAFRRVAFDRITTDPKFVISAWIRRYPQLWLGTRTEQIDLRAPRGSLAWTALKAAFYGLNVLVLVLGIAGATWSLVRHRQWAFFAVPPLYVAAIHIPFHNVETRYSLAALPFIYLFAALVIAEISRGWRMHPRGQHVN